MPNTANEEFFKTIVPPEPVIKDWYAKLGDALDLPFTTIQYYHQDKRAADLARSRLLRARAHQSKVHSKLDTLKNRSKQEHARNMESD